jgi:hypothetical protein
MGKLSFSDKEHFVRIALIHTMGILDDIRFDLPNVVDALSTRKTPSFARLCMNLDVDFRRESVDLLEGLTLSHTLFMSRETEGILELYMTGNVHRTKWSESVLVSNICVGSVSSCAQLSFRFPLKEVQGLYL